MTLDRIRSLIRDVPDFPKPGIVFKDITPLVADPVGFRSAVERMAAASQPLTPDVILAIESRGFIFGAALSHATGWPMQLVRKRGKLPRAAISMRYELEYGHDHLEVHADAIEAGRRYLIVDDLLATGGTVAAVVRLVQQQAGTVAGCTVLIELAFLNGRDQLSECPLVSLLTY